MEQLTFSQVKKGNLTFKSIGTPTGVQGQTPIFSLTKDGETVKYSTDGVNYEILGGGGALIFNNVAVAVADFVADTTYTDYPYRAAIALTGVALTMIANVVFDVTDATSGNFAPLSDTYAGGTYIYAKEVPAAAITIPTIYVLSEAASGGVNVVLFDNAAGQLLTTPITLSENLIRGKHYRITYKQQTDGVLTMTEFIYGNGEPIQNPLDSQIARRVGNAEGTVPYIIEYRLVSFVPNFDGSQITDVVIYRWSKNLSQTTETVYDAFTSATTMVYRIEKLD